MNQFIGGQDGEHSGAAKHFQPYFYDKKYFILNATTPRVGILYFLYIRSLIDIILNEVFMNIKMPLSSLIGIGIWLVFSCVID